jgi:aminopeptidase-like protein
MPPLNKVEGKDLTEIGRESHPFAAKLYPNCRSTAGEGLRQTLAAIQKRNPLQISEVTSGTEIFDWSVSKEWNIPDAYITDATENRIVDFQACNLHVLNYSTPIRKTMPLSELRPHSFTIPEDPNWIPISSRVFRSQKLHVRIALTTIILLSASAQVCHLNKLLRCTQAHRQEVALRGAV